MVYLRSRDTACRVLFEELNYFGSNFDLDWGIRRLLENASSVLGLASLSGEFFIELFSLDVLYRRESYL